MIKLSLNSTLRINWRKSNLSAQQDLFTIVCVAPLFFSDFFLFLFHLLFSLSLTLIIGIFYCLNYTSLLLHLIITHLVSHPTLSSIIFIISTLIIDIFYCPNYISLLLHLIITHLVNTFYNNYAIRICPRQLL